MKSLTTFLVCVLVVGIITTGGADASLTSLKTQLEHLEQDSNHLKTCVDKVTHPAADLSRFTGEIATIDHLIEKIEGRIQTTLLVLKGVMALPVVGQIASPVLLPTINVLTFMDSALRRVDSQISGVVSSVKGWSPELNKVVAIKSKVDSFVAAIAKARKGVQWAVDGLDLLPHLKETRVFSQLDKVARPLTSVVGGLNTGCSHVESFLHKIHLVSRKRSLPSLHKVISILNAIMKAFGPLGHPLDDINKLMSKKMCIRNGYLAIDKVIIKKVGKEVMHGIESAVKLTKHVGKQVSHHMQKVAHHVRRLVRHVFRSCHRVGRRDKVPKSIEVDGLGLKICFSIKDALKLVNKCLDFFLKEAEQLLKQLLSGLLSKIKIPGLGPEFLSLGNVLNVFNVRFPDVSSLTSLADTAVRDLQKMNPVQDFVKSVTGCSIAGR